VRALPHVSLALHGKAGALPNEALGFPSDHVPLRAVFAFK
jgi:hypothetical protein